MTRRELKQQEIKLAILATGAKQSPTRELRQLPDNWLHKFKPLPPLAQLSVNSYQTNNQEPITDNQFPTIEEQRAHWDTKREHDNDLRWEAVLDHEQESMEE